MSLNVAFKFESLDSTELLNRRLESLISRGIYSGGLLTPQSGTLTAIRSSFLGIGYDGITVYDLDQSIAAFSAGQTSYHVIYAKYNPLGTPATPTLQELVLSESSYNGHPDKNYLIVIAKVTLSGGATEVTAADIDYSARDEITSVSRQILRGSVANASSLPAQVSGQNRVNDIYITQAENSIYRWDGSAWQRIIAQGSAALDGAYDNAGGTPGSGRVITADAGAVEIQYATTAQRAQDIANSPFRIRDEGTTVTGSILQDLAMASGYFSSEGDAPASILVREPIISGTNLQRDEPCNITGGASSQLDLTRVGANLTYLTSGGSGWLVHLVEIRGSALNQDGLYACDVVSSTVATLRNLDDSSVVLSGESGLTATFYTTRYCVAGVLNKWGGVWATENHGLGVFGGSSVATVGSRWYFVNGGVTYPWRVDRLDSGTFQSILTLNSSGDLTISGTMTPSDILITGVSSGNGIDVTATNSGVACNLISDNGSALRVFSDSKTSASAAIHVTQYDQEGVGLYVGNLSGSPLTEPCIIGDTTANPAHDDSAGVGVHGVTEDGVGVKGTANGNGGGVVGYADGSGVGVSGESDSGFGVLGITAGDIGVAGNSFGYQSSRSIHVQVPITSFIGDGSLWSWQYAYRRWSYNTGSSTGYQLICHSDLLPHNAIITSVLVNWEADGTGHSVYVYKRTTVGTVAANDGGVSTAVSLGIANFSDPGGVNNSVLQLLTLSATESNRTFNKGTDLLELIIQGNNSGTFFRFYGIQVNFTFQAHGLNYPPSV